LHLGEKFLTVKIKQAYGKSDQRKKKYHAADDPEIHLSQDVLGAVREKKEDVIIFLRKYRQSQCLGYLKT